MKDELKIYINGQETTVTQGSSVLNALLGEGQMALKRSRRLHEPRGAVCGMGVCYECQVTIDGKPNIRSCMTTVESNMEIVTNV